MKMPRNRSRVYRDTPPLTAFTALVLSVTTMQHVDDGVHQARLLPLWELQV